MVKNQIKIKVDEYLKQTRLISCACYDCEFNYAQTNIREYHGCQFKIAGIDPNGKCTQMKLIEKGSDNESTQKTNEGREDSNSEANDTTGGKRGPATT